MCFEWWPKFYLFSPGRKYDVLLVCSLCCFLHLHIYSKQQLESKVYLENKLSLKYGSKLEENRYNKTLNQTKKTFWIEANITSWCSDFILFLKYTKKNGIRAVSSSVTKCCCAQAILAVCDELFNVHNHAGQRAGSSGLDAFIWGTWRVCAGCSVSTPSKMCTEPWASTASRKSACKGRAIPEAHCQHTVSFAIKYEHH